MKIEEQRREAGILTPKNLEEQAISLVGKDIYEILIKGYTEKQWGRKATELPAFIIKRLPVRFTFDNNYFNDKYQGIPVGGYNKLINGLLDGIEVRTNTDFFKIKNILKVLRIKFYLLAKLMNIIIINLGDWNIVLLNLKHKCLIVRIIKGMQL